MAIYFDSADIYVDSCADLRAKIAAIDNILAALDTAALKAAANAGIQEYMLNDGQTIIKKIYRSASEVEASITAFEKIRQRYINRLNGRVTRLVDGKNFNGKRI
jgi:hypothetical protein